MLNIKKNKQKGFSLIELLAVLIILSVIALIATPLILNVVSRAKGDIFLRSAEKMVDAAELKYATSTTEISALPTPYEIVYQNGALVGTNSINFKGKAPDQGIITINNTGQVSMILWDNASDKCVTKAFTDDHASFDDTVTTLAQAQVLISGEVPVILYPQVTDTNPGIIFSSTLVEDYAGNTTATINSVEDLVALSELAKTQVFTGKIVNIAVGLDFQNNDSYVNPNTTVFGDINGNTIIEPLKTELTTGKGFNPIGSLAVKFNGAFNGNAKYLKNLYINRSATDYVGLFGYTNTASVVKGINILNAVVTGKLNTGILLGYNAGTIYSVVAKGNVTGTNYVALATGSNSGSVNEVIVSGNVVGVSNLAGVIGYSNGGSITGAVHEGGIFTGTSGITRIANNISPLNNLAALKTILINGSTVSGTILASNNGQDMVAANINNINSYETTGLDTIIGGDNNADGYYFDYDSEGNVAVAVAAAPTITMVGAGTIGDPYQITSYAKLKQVMFNKTAYYKLMNDIDLSGKKTYMLASNSNRFSGTFDGNNKKLSNINIAALDNTGLFGYVTGTVKGLTIDNITVTGLSATGGLVGYGSATAIIKGITITNGTVTGTSYTGILAGNMLGTTSSALIRGNVVGTNYVAIAIGGNSGAVSHVIVSGNIAGTTGIAGVIGYSSGGSINGAVNEGGVYTGTSGLTRVANNVSPINNLAALKTMTINGGIVSGTILATNNGKDMDVVNINNLNSYETTGLDTIIGGDNDADGYYFDYDSEGNIALVPATLAVTMSGAGTVGDPYQVTSYAQLKQVSLNKSAYYKLMNDIDLTDKVTYMMASDFNRFAGYFDGNGMKISNASILGLDSTGLFGYLTGTVDDLTIENITSVGLDNTGALVGYSSAASTVKGVNVTGATVNGATYVGVLEGYSNGTVTDCLAKGNANGTNNVAVGLGYSTGVVTKIMVNGNVSGTANGAGVIGYGGGGSISVAANLGGTLNGTGSVTRIGNNIGLSNCIALNTILVKGATVSSSYNWTNNGLDTIATNMALQATYTGIGFNFTDTTVGTYIWKMIGSNIWVEKN